MAEPAFRAAIRACDHELGALADWRLEDELTAEDVSRLERTEVAQLAIFAIQLGLVAVLAERGIRPAAVAGHSLGEITAAHVAASLSLPDAVALLCERGRLCEELAAGGAMLVVRLPEEELRDTFAGREHELAVAAVNSRGSAVVSGAEAAVADLEAELTARGIATRRVRVSYGFHSPLLDADATWFRAALQNVHALPPSIPMYSTVSGAAVPREGFATDHWIRNARDTVRLADAVDAMVRDGVTTLVEVAPHPVLGADLTLVAAEHVPAPAVVPTLRRGGGLGELASTLARLYEAGADVDWHAIDPAPAFWADLPRYPWQHRPYWLDAPDEVDGERLPPAHERGPTAAELLDDVRTRVAGALEIPPAEVDVEMPADELGLDSLTIVELRNQVEARFGLNVPLTALFGGASLSAIAARMAAAEPGGVALLSDDQVLAALTAIPVDGGRG
jgi:acyl transferase domain-containing protein